MDNNKQFMLEFISTYENNRNLWDTASPDYLKTDKKEQSYKSLLEVMQKFKSDCNCNDIKKKINTLRSSYRRELKKIKLSEMSGVGVDHIYKPKIWWFDLFHFIKSSERKSKKNHNNITQYQMPQNQETPIKQEEMFKNDYSMVSKECDAFDYMTKAWAVKLREMDNTQKLLAERAINEILFQGQMNVLNLNTLSQISQIQTPNNMKELFNQF